MTITLEPQQEARLVAAAEAKGVSTEMLVREAVEEKLADMTPTVETSKGETQPIWEIFLEEMEDVPAEEWAKLPTDGASEHDHYLYGSPKRNL